MPLEPARDQEVGDALKKGVSARDTGGSPEIMSEGPHVEFGLQFGRGIVEVRELFRATPGLDGLGNGDDGGHFSEQQIPFVPQTD
jgi:hypothetical protein